ncbi:MAG: hypothetical protein LBB38_04345 [Puniceicoccales bacterium]|nr:hypothetical protein [Puniceicoccales bacterium]
MGERVTVFALRNLHPSGLAPFAAPGTLSYEHFHGDNFCIFVERQPISPGPILWAARSWDDSPWRRTAEIAQAAEAIFEICGEEPDLLLAYGECTRSNRLSCIAAYCRQLRAMAVRRIVFFDMHRADIANILGERAMQLPTTELWAKYAGTLATPIDAVVSPDLGREFAAASLAKLLHVEHVAMNKRRPNDEVPWSMRGKRAFVVDDEIVSGRTLMETVERLELAGAKSIDIAITYGFCSGEILAALASRPIVRSVAISDLIARPSGGKWKTIQMAGPLIERFTSLRNL